MIKFVGKRAAVKHDKAPTVLKVVQPAAGAAAAPAVVKSVKVGTGVDFATLKGKAWFGRPQFSANEIEAIASGGASEIL